MSQVRGPSFPLWYDSRPGPPDHRTPDHRTTGHRTTGHRTTGPPDTGPPDYRTTGLRTSGHRTAEPPDHRTPDHQTPDHRTPDHRTPSCVARSLAPVVGPRWHQSVARSLAPVVDPRWPPKSVARSLAPVGTRPVGASPDPASVVRTLAPVVGHRLPPKSVAPLLAPVVGPRWPPKSVAPSLAPVVGPHLVVTRGPAEFAVCGLAAIAVSPSRQSHGPSQIHLHTCDLPSWWLTWPRASWVGFDRDLSSNSVKASLVITCLQDPLYNGGILAAPAHHLPTGLSMSSRDLRVDSCCRL